MSEREALLEALRANVRLDGHEKECITFRKAILSRFSRLEWVLYSALGFAIMLLANMALKGV